MCSGGAAARTKSTGTWWTGATAAGTYQWGPGGTAVTVQTAGCRGTWWAGPLCFRSGGEAGGGGGAVGAHLTRVTLSL